MITRMTTNYLLALAIGFVFVGCVGCAQKVSIPALVSVTNIVFTVKGGLDTNEWRHFSICDTNKLARLIANPQLKVKQPCKCAHVFEAQIQSPSGDVHASFCDHCFDIVGGQFAGEYDTPSVFYDEFQKLVHEKSH